VEGVVTGATTPGSVVAVVSKGDPNLLELNERTGLHFPRDAEGRYAGYYPRTSEEAVAQIESLRADGARFLCLPATASWWLDHYRGLAAWLNAHCRVAAHEPDVCLLYDLLRPPGDAAAPKAGPAPRARALLDALLPDRAMLFVAGADPDDYAAPRRQVARLGADYARGLRQLDPASDGEPTFIFVARSPSAPPLDERLEALLARRTEMVARREDLCDVLRLRTVGGGEAGIGAADPDAVESRAATANRLGGELAEKLAGRLELLAGGRP
jgi:hypothetical protein